jgi:hypothetical protein
MSAMFRRLPPISSISPTSRYYQEPVDVLAQMLPRSGAQHGDNGPRRRRRRIRCHRRDDGIAAGMILNPDRPRLRRSTQRASFAVPCKVTGSGKTEVYLAAAAACITAGGWALLWCRRST